MPDLITRSIAMTATVDAQLAQLAAVEDTTRADLVREALTMLLRTRGIDLDARCGVDTTRVGAGHRRDRRQSVGDGTRRAFLDWWTEHREVAVATCRHPEHLEDLVQVIADNIDRHGRVYVDPVAELVPGTWQADYAKATAVHAALLALSNAGGIDLHRPRRGRPSIRPAPWLTDDERSA
jgi:hypothetical protein